MLVFYIHATEYFILNYLLLVAIVFHFQEEKPANFSKASEIQISFKMRNNQSIIDTENFMITLEWVNILTKHIVND